MSTEYDEIVQEANLSSGKIVKTFKDQVVASVDASISNDLTTENNTADITISAKDLYGDNVPTFLMYIDEYPLQQHGIIHNIYGVQYFDTQDALNGLGTFNTYSDGLATNVQVSNATIATGEIVQHRTFGNVQHIDLDFSSATSGTNVDITLPQIAYNGITKQAMVMRYRIHKSANATITNNVSAVLSTDENWHMLAKVITSPIAPKITITSNVANDADHTVIEIASYYAYNLDNTPMPTDVATFLKAVLSKGYNTYADLDDDAMQYTRMYDATPQLPTVIRTNGDFNILVAITGNTVAGAKNVSISTPTDQVTLNNDFYGTNYSYTQVAMKRNVFTYVMAEQQITSASNNIATLSANLTSGMWRIYYPATITLNGYVIAEQKTVDASKNVIELPKVVSFSVPINVIVDTKDTIGNMPDNYDCNEYEYRNTYSVTVNAV